MSAEDQIRQYAERIVRLEQERKALAEDIKECKAEAKAAGFSPKLIATCVRIMLMEAEKRAEALSGHEELDLYLGAVGLIARADVFETRRDDGGRGQRAPTADSGVPVPANAEAAKVVVRAAQRASATDHVIRSSAAGSSLGGPPLLRKAETGAKRESAASVSATKILAAVAVAASLAACTDDPTARRTAAASGITEVETTGYAVFGCDKNDTFHTGFVGRGVDGGCVEGVVCSGLLKGGTMRITGPSDACPRKPVARR
jgi:uncharacterized protein (UPF0335 family)